VCAEGTSTVGIIVAHVWCTAYQRQYGSSGTCTAYGAQGMVLIVRDKVPGPDWTARPSLSPNG
jgi:hypothetical protein